MIAKADALTERLILEAYHSGELIHHIFDRFSNYEDIEFNSIVDICAALHNDTKINILALINTSRFEGISGFNFFRGQHFFCEIIPKLNATNEEMMRCVSRLVEKGGDDLAANQPNAAFRAWCEVDIIRAKEIVVHAKNNNDLAKMFLTFALTAGNMIEESQYFLENCTDDRRLSAAVAIGRIHYNDIDSAHHAISILLHSLNRDPDDALNANVLTAALEIAKKHNLTQDESVINIVEFVCNAIGPITQLCCARALDKILHVDVIRLLFGALKSIDPSHNGIIQDLDISLGQLLRSQYANMAIDFITDFLKTSDIAWGLSEFDSFSHALINVPEEQFQHVFVSWMLSGEPHLCEGISKLFRIKSQDDKSFEIPIENFNLSSLEQVFICRKTIGYFFLQPVVAASIIVSVLRVCDDDVAKTIQNLLFDPLLINYSGSLLEYLKNIDKNDLAYNRIQEVLEKNNTYFIDLQSAANIKELHPSEHQRQMESLRFQNQMQKAHKEAEQESTILRFVTRSIILYGRRSITYISEADSEIKPMEIELKETSFTFETPRMEITDPFGFDYMIRVFRSERLTS